MHVIADAVSMATDLSAGGAPKRMVAAAKEFESVMLNQWLQSAESSFGAAPGGGEDEDQGGQQMKGFATQQLAGQLAAHGGIGLAKLVQSGLAKAHEVEHRSTNAGRATL
jgi:Rod binding domain-containing protein